MMETVPIAWLVSIAMMLAAYVIVWSTRIPGRTRFFLCAFFTSLTVVTVFLGLRVSLDWNWPARLQPFVAILAAPSAYLGFAALTVDRGPQWTTILIRDLAFVCLVAVGMAAPIPVSPDLFILAINSVYLVRLSGLLSYHPDDFSSVPPQTNGVWRAAMIATIALIGLMVAADGLVFASGMLANAPQLMTLLTGVSGIFAGFVLIVVLVGVPLLLNASRHETSGRGDPSPSDLALMERLHDVMQTKELYRDSNLTLVRIAKRLSVPARELSSAINRATNENFSRFINGYRVNYAKTMLKETDLAVTEIMLEAGFLSKSSFNTEFRRIVGLTPSAYRSQGAQVPDAPQTKSFTA